MRRFYLAGLLVAVVLSGGSIAAACSRPSGAQAIESELAGWINAERANRGLPRLATDTALGKAALAHACDMAKRKYFSHSGPGGPSFQARLKKAGYRFSAAVENIGKSKSASSGAAAKIWRGSSAHWDNILNPSIREIGVAVTTDGANIYYVFVGGAN